MASTGCETDYVVVGAGVNGTSIAHALVSQGFSVAVLERSADGFVAPDGASHDLNKIIRADYTDDNYCTLAKEAISRWRTHPVLSRFYHEVGVLFRSSDKGTVFASQGSGSAEEYVHKGVRHAHLERDAHLEIGTDAVEGKQVPDRRAYVLQNDAQVREILAGVREDQLGKGLQGMGRWQTGYFNPRGGWADANKACRALLEHAIQLGVKVYPNATVAGMVWDTADAKVVSGVRTTDGRVFRAKHVVLAAGAWTSNLLTRLSPDLGLEQRPSSRTWMTRPSAQCVAILRLTPAEAAALQSTPVIINFSSGFYQFEPVFDDALREWHIKIAYHSNGYLHPQPPVECSGTYPSFHSIQGDQTGAREIGQEGDCSADIGYEMAQSSIPANRLEQMLAELAQIYPHLAQHERLVSTRVCWYSDTLDENWIIDSLANHPSLPPTCKPSNVWVVSGDSGHAYKFLPILGDLFFTISRLSPNTRNLDLAKFSFAHQSRLHSDKATGSPIHSADSNRFIPPPSTNSSHTDKVNLNLNSRARL